MYLKRDKKIYDKEITRKIPKVNYEGENFSYPSLLNKQENAVSGINFSFPRDHQKFYLKLVLNIKRTYSETYTR